MLNAKLNGQLYEDEAMDIIRYMYNAEDAEVLLQKIKVYQVPQEKIPPKKLTREEQLILMNERDKFVIDFSIFQKVILDFQFKAHEKFLQKFVEQFRIFDQDNNGILNEVASPHSSI